MTTDQDQKVLDHLAGIQRELSIIRATMQGLVVLFVVVPVIAALAVLLFS